MTAGLILSLVPAVWLGFVLLNLLLCPRAIRPGSTKGVPKLSVLVPARNEAPTIGPCVESLIRQTYPDFELIVLDDHSTDGTGAIARAAAGGSERFRLVRGRPLPEGWLGKSWACQQLASAARSELLLFLDADTVAEPDLLLRLVATAQRRRVDLLSGFPKARYGSLGEALLIALRLVSAVVTVPLWLIPKRNQPGLVAATGACLLIRRETYRRVGGHASIRQSRADDLALATLVKRNRGRVLFCNLSDAYQCRFYRSAREAWSASVMSLFGRSKFFLLFATALMGLLFVLPPAHLALALLADGREGEVMVWAVGTVASLLMGALICRLFRLPVWLGLTASVQAILCIGLTVTAVWRTLSHQGHEWKGRRYA